MSSKVEDGFFIKKMLESQLLLTCPLPPIHKSSLFIPLVNMSCQGRSAFLQHIICIMFYDEQYVVVVDLFFHGRI